MVTLVYNTDPVTGKGKEVVQENKNDNDLEDKIKVPDEVQKVIDIVKETKQKEDKEFHQVVEEVKKRERENGIYPLETQLISLTLDFPMN